MPQFKIYGTRDGQTIKRKVEAASAEQAREVAEKRGVQVERVEAVEREPEPPVQRVAPTPPIEPPPQSVQAGHAAAAPAVNVHLPKRSSSLGIVGFILGVLALLICWIPLLGMVAIPLGGLALLMGGIAFIVALARQGTGIGWPIGAVAVAGIATLAGLLQLGVLAGGAAAVGEAADQAAAERERLASEWDPPQGFEQADLGFEVVDTAIEHMPMETVTGREGRSENEQFVAWLSLANQHEGRRLEVRDLQPGFGEAARLEDSAGNRYRGVSLHGGDVAYPTGRFNVDPGRTGEVALIFEPPVAGAQELTLEVPAERFGGRGTVVLDVPVP